MCTISWWDGARHTEQGFPQQCPVIGPEVTSTGNEHRLKHRKFPVTVRKTLFFFFFKKN